MATSSLQFTSSFGFKIEKKKEMSPVSLSEYFKSLKATKAISLDEIL